ncbi:MAG: ComF family protein [Clostridiales bacterium]|nr:ComF family protein [Clostridiales bacterium]
MSNDEKPTETPTGTPRKRGFIRKFLFPERLACIFCDDELPFDSDYSACEVCLNKLNEKFCSVCGRPVAIPGVCDNCDSRAGTDYKWSFALARSAAAYEGYFRGAVARFKYGGAKYLAKYFARFMLDVYNRASAESGFCADVITYVPLHTKRLRARGYNQAKLLAECLGGLLGLPVADALVKNTHTVNLARLKSEERRLAIKDSFSLNTRTMSDITGKKALLIDDVFTTGSTVNECARMLRTAKSSDIFVLTMCSVAAPKTGGTKIKLKKLKSERLKR